MKNSSSNTPQAPTTENPKDPTRRQFLSTSGALVAGSVLAGASIPPVFAGEDNTLRLALVGCGGRGSGAVANALSSETGPTKLVAMADLFEDKMSKSYGALTEKFGNQVDVPADRKFLGFDAYRKAIDCLRPGDVLIQATHAGFRPTHLKYAVEKGVHVFMEKSFASDPGGTHEVLRLGEEAEKKNLKIATGLMCRHSSSRQALIQQIREGALGEVLMTRAYRLDGGIRLEPYRGGENELLWQIRHPYGFFWVSAGKFVDWNIHQVDECCWIKDAWPVSALGLGGRGPGDPDRSQNFHTYSIEYTFADGTKALVEGRGMRDCYNDFVTYVHGTKCAAEFSGNVHAPTAKIFKDQRIDANSIAWKPEEETKSPYQEEWDVLLKAIREDTPHNEVKRSALTNLVCLMGRAAVHTGKLVTWEEMMASNFKFCEDVGQFTLESPPPIKPDSEGWVPVPVPGEWKEI